MVVIRKSPQHPHDDDDDDSPCPGMPPATVETEQETEHECETVEMLCQLRALLKFAAKRSESGRGHDPDPRKSELTQLVRWRQLFLKFDQNHSGGLTLRQMGKLIRVSLRLSDRVLPESDLAIVLRALDSNEDGFITFADFTDFLRGQKKKSNALDSNAIKTVGRAVRLALRRKHLSVGHIRQLEPPVDDTGLAGLVELKDFFRHDLGITKRECSDRSIVSAFRMMRQTETVSLSKEELLDFIQEVWEAGAGISNLDGDASAYGILSPAAAAGSPPPAAPAASAVAVAGGGGEVERPVMKGLVGSMGEIRKSLRAERPKSGQRGAETLPFKALGRSKPPADRFSATSSSTCLHTLPFPILLFRGRSQQQASVTAIPSNLTEGKHGRKGKAKPGRSCAASIGERARACRDLTLDGIRQSSWRCSSALLGRIVLWAHSV